ncbi:MAG TPA: hypothetical protein VFK29_07200 [Rhodanobacteraceae bacterium]|jgi:hypothetical protein|nr:hypothetical protein [Rhodanobacteraceae bacterium]
MRHKTQTVSRARHGADGHRHRRQPFRHAAAAPTFARGAGARIPPRLQPGASQDPITLGATTWLACGIVLLGLTPLPLRDGHLGWSLTFWALAAPSLILLARRMRRRKS